MIYEDDNKYLEYVLNSHDLKTFETLIHHVNPTADISSFSEKLLSNIKNETRRLFENKEFTRDSIALAVPLNARLIGEIPLDLIKLNITDKCEVKLIEPKITYQRDNVDWDIDSTIIKMLLRGIKQRILFHATFYLQKHANKIKHENLIHEIENYKTIICHISEFYKIFSPEGEMWDFHSKLHKIGWVKYNFQNKTIIVINDEFAMFDLCGIDEPFMMLEGGILAMPFILVEDKNVSIHYTTQFNIKYQ